MSIKERPTKALYLFLLFYFFLWGLIPGFSLSSVFPDTAQNFSWGHVIAWGYDQHPPLGAWVITFLNSLLHNKELSAYCAGAGCLILSLWLTYKIARIYLTEESAIAATLLSSLSYYYVVNFVLQYNQNTIMMPAWLATVYFFIQAIEKNKLLDWILLSITAALAMLAKYESGIIIFLAFAYLLVHFKRAYLSNLLQCSVLFFILLIPHLIWLFHTGFLPIKYAMRSAYPDPSIDYTDTELYYSFLAEHIQNPLSCLIVQPLNLLLCFLVFLFCLFKKCITRSSDPVSSKGKILIYFGVAPLLLVSFISAVTGASIRPEWGFPLVSLSVVGLFYYAQITTQHLKTILKLVIALQVLVFTVYFSIEYFPDSLYLNRPTEMHFPGKLIAKKAEILWEKSGYQPQSLAFVGGNGSQAFFYLDSYFVSHPELLVHNSLHRSPWINKAAFLKSKGMLIYTGCNPDDHQAEINKKFIVDASECIWVPAAYKRKRLDIPYTLYVVTPRK